MKISYINYKKEFPNNRGLFKDWFKIDRYFKGRLIHISVKHRSIVLDFRKDLFFEMTGKNQ